MKSDDHWMTDFMNRSTVPVQCCFMSTETIRTATSTLTQLLSSELRLFNVALRPQTIRTIRDREPRTTTSTLTQFLSPEVHWLQVQNTYLDETGGYAGARGDHCLHATIVDHKIAHWNTHTKNTPVLDLVDQTQSSHSVDNNKQNQTVMCCLHVSLQMTPCTLIIIITDICKVPTPRLKALNKHNTHNVHQDGECYP